MDVAYTREIALYQRDELKRTGQYDWFTKAVMPAVPTLIAMTKRGIKVDAERRARWLEELSADETEREARWRILTGGVHPASPKQVSEYLYDTLGLPVQYGATGGRSADINSLRELLAYVAGRPDTEQNRFGPVLKGLIDYRTVAKLRSTYAERALGGDGCIHPSYLPASKDEEGIDGKGLAGTGRITSRDPNIQNQPIQVTLSWWRRTILKLSLGLLRLSLVMGRSSRHSREMYMLEQWNSCIAIEYERRM
jgi:DNA polymerase-1